jgi:hypothetical protein
VLKEARIVSKDVATELATRMGMVPIATLEEGVAGNKMRRFRRLLVPQLAIVAPELLAECVAHEALRKYRIQLNWLW